MTDISGDTLTTVIDCGAVLLVLLCALIGAYRGMIRMLAGLAVVILSLVGATFIAAQFADQVTDMVTPALESRVTDAVEKAMDGQDWNRLISGYAETQAEESLESALEETSFNALRFDFLSELFDRLKAEHTLPGTVTDSLQERFEEMRKTFSGTISQALSAVLKEIVRPIVHGLLYVLSFMILSFVLKIVFRSLDGVKAIPGLRSVNMTGGFVLGFIQGLVLLIAAAFLLRFAFAGIEGVSDSRALKFLSVWLPSLSFP